VTARHVDPTVKQRLRCTTQNSVDPEHLHVEYAKKKKKMMMMMVMTVTCAEGVALLVLPVRWRPLVNQLITAGGLLIAETHVSVIVSPALALPCPLMVTFSGATAVAATRRHTKNHAYYYYYYFPIGFFVLIGLFSRYYSRVGRVPHRP